MKLPLREKGVNGEHWKPGKKVIRKTKRISGESYLTTTGNICKKRKPRNLGCECLCKQKCHLKISDECKLSVANAFWALQDLNRQRDFIAKNVERERSERGRVELSRRHKHSYDTIKFATDHIDSFPQVPAHWCQKDSKKEYLKAILNKRKIKVAAKDEKTRDAEKVKADCTYVSTNFDLEAVLYTIFNFTVYEIGNHQGHCYMWTEYDGNRGANKIATCLMKFIVNLPPTVHHLVLHSDCCPGQNRNTMLHQAVVTKEHLQMIYLKFLKPGPNDWITIADFINYKNFQEKVIISKNKAENGNILSWKNVKWLRFEKEKPNFTILNIGQKGRKSSSTVRQNNLQTLYSFKIPIKKLKYDNLQELCKSKDGLILVEYHNFYKSLSAEGFQNTDSLSDDEDEMSLQAMKSKMLKRKRK
ncbi:hypothetical protein RN001_004267 [Aquatica leii]|uniref:Uncharacterized protein n=1 Tax=Aquatica leii TaxID=1421715 RepID=A0AAN7SPH1_9COLE|nr:hypothetical protein RN001_004267 [Aquatica leii]